MLKKPKHNYPCKHVVIGASHNKVASQSKADKIILKKVKQYEKRGVRFPSYKFLRVKDSLIDQNKFLLPLYGDVPIFSFLTINMVMSGLNVSVVGSKEIGLVVELLKDYLYKKKKVPKHKLCWVDEGKNLSLKSTLTKGSSALDLQDNDFFYFITGDIPFFYDVVPILYDKDIVDNVLLLDFNSKQSIFKFVNEFFPRNYYHKLRFSKNEVHDIKEPNVYGFSPSFDFTFGQESYNDREGGGFTPLTLVRMMNYQLKNNPEIISNLKDVSQRTYFRMFEYVIYEFCKKLGLGVHPVGDVKSAEELVSAIFNAPVKVKAHHNDPFRCRDIDAWEDYFYYSLLIEDMLSEDSLYPVKTLSQYMPNSELIVGFDNQMKEIKDSIGVLRDPVWYCNLIAKRLDMPLPYNEHGRLVATLQTGEQTIYAKRALSFQKSRHSKLEHKLLEHY